MRLIKITEENGCKAVSARDLYEFLEVKTDFTDWCKRMFDYGFEENIDYTILLKNKEKVISKSNPMDYALILDCAKEISMLQRSEKGKQARQYFIQCEKAALENHKRLASPKEMAQMVIDAENAREEAECKLARQQPKVDYAISVLNSNSFRTANEIATDLGITANKLNSILHSMGVQYKQGLVWMLYAKYRKFGYAMTRTDIKNGHTYIQMVWSEKGRAFIHSLLNPTMIRSLEVKKQNTTNLRIN